MKTNRKVVRLTESKLRRMIAEAVQETLNEYGIEKEYFVADDGDGVLNPFSMDMFDEEGYLEGHEGEDGYNIEDFDIIRYFNTWDQACAYCDRFCK